MEPECYPHPVNKIKRIETHISWVFLAAEYAYKIKKPVELGFLDFSTLDARRHYCEEELRLNRRLAPQLYLDVVPIGGSREAPRICSRGAPLEYALRMRRFPQDAIGDRLLVRGELTDALVANFARRLAEFHSQLSPAAPDSLYGTPESVLHNARDNFRQITPMLSEDDDLRALEALREWAEREFNLGKTELRERRSAGMVRECHGDLHLGNIVLIDSELVPFDCIEFNADLRWNDVMSEVAFLMMDLADRGAPRLAWLFLNAYLEKSDGYAGLTVLRFYLVYRALVRAKIHLMRAQQSANEPAERSRLITAYRTYIELAAKFAQAWRPALVLMRGLSGSGKSTITRELIQALGAVHVSSDVERKRLHGIKPMERSGSKVESALYAADSTEDTYDRLAELALAIAQAGLTAIVDATCLRRWQRTRLKAIADKLEIPMVIFDVEAPHALLRERIARRTLQALDPSDATVQVLEQQIASAEPITPDEELSVIRVSGRENMTTSTLEILLRRIGSELRGQYALLSRY